MVNSNNKQTSLNQQIDEIEAQQNQQSKTNGFQETPQKQDKAKQDRNNGAAILMALDGERNFRLYSYRIITHQQFIETQTEIATTFLESLKFKK